MTPIILILLQITIILAFLKIIFQVIDRAVVKLRVKIRRFQYQRTYKSSYKTPRTKKIKSRYIPKRLLLMVSNDIETAQRLVESAQLRNPGKSKSWCIEKAIRDLERDKRV